MKWNVPLVLILGGIATAPLACGSGEQPSGAPAGSAGATSAAATATAAAAGANAKSLALGDFLSKLPPAACGWIDQCKNEKFKALAGTMGMMIAGFGAMDKPALADKLKPVDEAMKKDKRPLPNKQECETIGSIAMEATGLTTATLEAKLDKTVKYDGEKAAACLAAIESPFAPCGTEVKLEGEPKLTDVEKFEKELEGPLDAHTKVCDSVLTGLVDLGAACEYDFECKGEHTKCKKDSKDPKQKVCVAGEAKH